MAGPQRRTAIDPPTLKDLAAGGLPAPSPGPVRDGLPAARPSVSRASRTVSFEMSHSPELRTAYRMYALEHGIEVRELYTDALAYYAHVLGIGEP